MILPGLHGCCVNELSEKGGIRSQDLDSENVARTLEVDLLALKTEVKSKESELASVRTELAKLLTPGWTMKAREARFSTYSRRERTRDISLEMDILRRKLRALNSELSVYHSFIRADPIEAFPIKRQP